MSEFREPTPTPPGDPGDPGAPAETDRADVAAFLRSRGEREFLRLYDRHTDGLYRFAARLVGRTGGASAEADEIVQETWLRALAAMATFRWQSSLRTWLCGIAFNRWREFEQRAGRERTFAVVAGGRAESRAEARENRPGTGDPGLGMALEQAIRGLPEGYREVLLLHDLEGYTHEEIARHFGIAEGTSKSQLHRARRALREALAERGVAHHG